MSTRALLRSRLRALAPPLVVLVAALLVWELLVAWLEPPRFLLCSPADIARAASHRAGELARATWITTQSVLIGFGAAAIAGVAGALLLSASRLMERAFYPFTVILQTVPLVAIAPMLVLWLGPGVPAVSVCAFIVCLFPVITNTLGGVRAIPAHQSELFALYGASAWATLHKLILPGALPSILTGLRIAAGLAVIGAVVGEFVAGDMGTSRGLGIVIVVAAKRGDVPILFAAVILSSLLGILLLGAVSTAAHALLRKWHVSQRDD